MSLVAKELLNIGERRLEEYEVLDAGIDCKILYCYLMGISTSRLFLEYQRVIPDNICEAYFQLLDRRCAGEPVQYIVGEQDFMGLEFKVSPSVLIPRQDTETLVEDVIEVISKNTLRGEEIPHKEKKEYKVLDLCTGSGAIGVSLAALCENVKVTCSDVSKDALEIAKENGQTLAKGKSLEFKEGSLFEPFTKRFKNKTFDIIVSNPPYVKSKVIPHLQREVKDHEPMLALDGGENGLDFYKIIVEEADKYLEKGGILALEIGHDQREEVTKLLEDTGKYEKIVSLKDLPGRDRIIFGFLK